MATGTPGQQVARAGGVAAAGQQTAEGHDNVVPLDVQSTSGLDARQPPTCQHCTTAQHPPLHTHLACP